MQSCVRKTGVSFDTAMTMINDARSDLHQPSECRNPRYRAIYEQGRTARFFAALYGDDAVPLFSHYATYQSLFLKSWQSVTRDEIRLFLDTYRQQDSCVTPSGYCRCVAVRIKHD